MKTSRVPTIFRIAFGVLALVASARPTKAGPPYDFRPLTPCRVIDTRVNTLPQGGQTNGMALVNPGPYLYRLQGNCGIPNGAVAVVLSVTAIAPTQTGFLNVYPANVSPSTSVLNYPAGIAAIANGNTIAVAPVTLASDKDIAVVIGMATTGSLHLTIDITGYFQ